MRKPNWTPTTVPYGADQTAYLVVDRFGGLGSVYRETEVERTDLETIITDLLSGQFNDPIRVVAFNTLEHWSRDVSEDIALEIQTRCDIQGAGVPEHIQDFVANYTGPDASFWEPENEPFEGPIHDPDVQSALLANKAKVVEEFDLEKELLEVSRSLNSERIKRIADQITPDALYSLIKARENESMRAIIYVGLEFARIGNASEDMLKIVSATKQALGMIAQESKLNAARVKKYGINPEIQTAAKRKDSRSSPLKEAKEKGRPASQCE